MFEIHVTISCPDILAAVRLLAGHSDREAACECAKDRRVSEPTSSAAAPVTTPVTPAPMAASVTAPVYNSAPVTAPVPTTTPPVSTVPLSQGPVYTVAQIAKAGADLISQNPGLLPQVNALLTQYGAQAVTDVKPEHFGAFATALRGMGAKI